MKGEGVMFNMKLSFFTENESFPFFIQYGEHSEKLDMHGHEDFSELVIVLSGRAEHIVDSERFSVRRGDVFVMGSGIAHGYENPQDFHICNIMFRPEALLSADYDIKRLAGFHALFLLEPHFNTAQGFQSRLRLAPDSFGEIERLIKAAVDEYSSDNAGKETMLTALFMQIVVVLSRLYGCTEKQREITGIAQAAAYMEEHFAEDFSVSELLAVSHYSQRHFIRLFSAAYHTTPQKYLLNIRLRHACAKLREGVLNITEVATRCGFSDSNYFSRVFKKELGVTPSVYRGTERE